MAEEQFTSRRARREAERLAAEQAFEAREVPEQPTEAPNSRADLLSPLPPKKPDAAPRSEASGDESETSGDDRSSRIDPSPAPPTNHERGALASDHPVQTRPPVHAEDRLDPQRTPLPHFQSRAEKKRYLKEHGLSLNGDLSTGAMPVVADEQELAEREAAAEGRLTGPVPEVAEATGEDDAPVDSSAAAEHQTSAAETTEAKSSASEKPSKKAPESKTATASSDEPLSGMKADPAAPTGDSPQAEHESYDAAGFGGASEEVAARDFEAPVTAASAPRPTTLDDEPYDALSMPYSALDGTDPQDPAADSTAAEPDASAQAAADESGSAPADTDGSETAGTSGSDSAHISGGPVDASTPSAQQPSPAPTQTPSADDAEPTSRSRRMPIVQPPSTSGVRVVTAASAQIPEVDDNRSAASDSASSQNADSAPSAPITGAGEAKDRSANETGSDDAARALAANPETRPMDAVPEAWALPNSDYEDEETENPPGTRIRASSVTGQDGQILMGEEPSKMPYIVLGVAAFFALALIVIALVMFL